MLDWDFVSKHVDDALAANDELAERVYNYINKKNIDLDRIKELYRDGAIASTGEKLTFSEWFSAYVKQENEEIFFRAIMDEINF